VPHPRSPSPGDQGVFVSQRCVRERDRECRPAAGLIVIKGRRPSAAQTSGMDMRREHRRLLP
jgi:hypothetical protein